MEVKNDEKISAHDVQALCNVGSFRAYVEGKGIYLEEKTIGRLARLTVAQKQPALSSPKPRSTVCVWRGLSGYGQKG
jgi:hypothetical protein